MISETIGHYRIEEKLGEGGVGEVYRALDTVLARPVAFKRLRPELARREDVVERFRAEARTLARLDHPNVATLHHFDRHGDDWFMVMEYVAGETLAALLRRCGRLGLDDALPIFVQALDGLGCAHEQGIVHRDIKGSNLIVKPSGIVKIMDFGIARVLGAERLTLLGHPVGTPEYMAPEQIRGEDIDGRADIYALGALFFALLSGLPPFSGRSDYELMRAHLEEEPPSLAERVDGIPDHVVAAIDRALAKDPAERFESTGAFRSALTRGANACAPRPIAGASARAGAPSLAPESDAIDSSRVSAAFEAGEVPVTRPLDLPPMLGDGSLPDDRSMADGSWLGTSPGAESDTRTLTGPDPATRRLLRGAIAGIGLCAFVVAGVAGLNILGRPDPAQAGRSAVGAALAADPASILGREFDAVFPFEDMGPRPENASGATDSIHPTGIADLAAPRPPLSATHREPHGESRNIRDLPIAPAASPAARAQPVGGSAEEKKAAPLATRSDAHRPAPASPAAGGPQVRVRRDAEPTREELEGWRIRRQ